MAFAFTGFAKVVFSHLGVVTDAVLGGKGQFGFYVFVGQFTNSCSSSDAAA